MKQSKISKDEKYHKIKSHMEQKVLERKNNIQLSSSDWEKQSLHPNYL